MDVRGQMDRIYGGMAPEDIPWNRREPPGLVVQLVESRVVAPCEAVDLGCGLGHYTRWLASRGFQVTGLDISAKAIELARRAAADAGVSCNFVVADLRIVRKVSSGNALPPFFVGTTTQLYELPTNPFAEQYEGCLVKINGPLTVVRTSLTGGLGQNNAFLVVNPAAPSDSVFIDGNKLTTYATPAVGTQIFSVQGILNQATRSYRIMLRNGNDIVVNTPPNVADAYPVQDNVIKVKFDRDVTAGSATTTSNYSLASFGSVDAAVMSGADALTEYYASFDKTRRARLEVTALGTPLGDPRAPVTFHEFADFECPFCQQLRPKLEAFVKRHPGRVKLVFRPFPIPGHPHAEPAAEAAEWARDQGIFWPFHDAMFDNPRALDTESLVALAERLGKDGASLRKALADRKYRDRVQAGLVEGRRAGVIGTPSLFINGRRHVIPDYSDTVLEFILDDEEQWMKNGWRH